MTKRTQKERILRVLKNDKSHAGWIHFNSLNNICFRYGARIYDLRQDGYNIEKKQVNGVWYYRLKESL